LREWVFIRHAREGGHPGPEIFNNTLTRFLLSQEHGKTNFLTFYEIINLWNGGGGPKAKRVHSLKFKGQTTDNGCRSFFSVSGPEENKPKVGHPQLRGKTMYGLKCPKCGLMQLPKEQCESCGTRLDSSKGPVYARRPLPLSPPSFSSPSEEIKDLTEMIHTPSGVRIDRESRHLSFHGTGGQLFGIYLLNTLLTIFTLGLYSFWGKTKVRAYLWGKTQLEEDRFVYHGTGRELLNGAFKAMLVFGFPLTLLNTLPKFLEPKEILEPVVLVLTYATILVFFPVALVGARRYRFSRTSWRGIHFSFRGKIWDFLRLFLRGSVLTFLTLGLYYPFFDTQRHGFMVSNSYFGSKPFRFDGAGRDLFKAYLLALLLFAPTLGLYWFWFMAKKQRYFWEHSHLDTIHFRSTVTGGRLLAFHLGNFFLLILTLGLAWSWVMIRKIRFNFAYLTLEGVMDPAKVRQEAQAASATGDALAGFMDASFDLGS
jgi:uncharacterized membrane protein YjgN (DUF898 family)